MDITNRIEMIVDEKYGRSWNKLAKALGITASTLQRVKDGGGVKADFIIRFCEINKINTDWLLTGEGAKHNYAYMTLSAIKELADKGDKDAKRMLHRLGLAGSDFNTPLAFLTINEIEEKAEQGDAEATRTMQSIEPSWVSDLNREEGYQEHVTQNESKVNNVEYKPSKQFSLSPINDLSRINQYLKTLIMDKLAEPLYSKCGITPLSIDVFIDIYNSVIDFKNVKSELDLKFLVHCVINAKASEQTKDEISKLYNELAHANASFEKSIKGTDIEASYTEMVIKPMEQKIANLNTELNKMIENISK